jgi:dihydroorotate dehydrogenase subfamily 1
MIKTHMMGIEMDNPVVVVSGPWSRGSDRMKKALECGAGAVVTESIVSEAIPEIAPRYAYNSENEGIQNIRLYSNLELENWIDVLTEIDRAKRYGSKTKVIASIMGTTPSEMAYIARKVEKTGVDGIEAGIACPMGEGPEIIAGDPVKVYNFAKAIVDAVSIPVSVKLSAATGNLPLVVKACNKAGLSGISGIDTIRGILDIDIDTQRPKLATYGGYSGAPIRPIGLSTIAGIAQSTDLPIVGIGGIKNYEHLLEYIFVGASAGGIGSEILLRGYSVIGEILMNLDNWLAEQGISSIEEIKGNALGSLKSFEEIKVEDLKSDLLSKCTRSDCQQCVACCLDEAITFNKEIEIDKDICTGCGICIDKCPDQKLKLVWK